MKWRKIAPAFFAHARHGLWGIVDYVTQVVTKQARKRASKIRQFRVDATLVGFQSKKEEAVLYID